MTPWKYNDNNLFLPITPIILPENIIDNNNFNKYEINGLLVGKCISHICSKNLQDKLLLLLDSLEYKLFSVIRPLHNFSEIPSYLNNSKEKYCCYFMEN
jgi:hypothetical protein